MSDLTEPNWELAREQVRAALCGMGWSDPDRPSSIERRFLPALDPDNLAEVGRACQAFADAFKGFGWPRADPPE